ncbi:MAG: hypothetical protein H0X38_16860 [Planctomycetes bacterium]|nr:hypothetical protein [Planctomycetota bacterium]
MTPAAPAPAHVLTLNGGSSSIKFAVFACAGAATRTVHGSIAGIGRNQGAFTVAGSELADALVRTLAIPDHQEAVRLMVDWITERFAGSGLSTVGHRVVHGGPSFWEPQRITAALVDELRQLSPVDPEHLPEEFRLIEAIQRRFPDLPQVACFDTAFHHDLPRVARALPIPRRYQAQGLRRRRILS